MASLPGPLVPPRAAAVLLVAALLGLWACDSGGFQESTPLGPREPPVDLSVLGGPLTLTIVAPDSSVTERVLSPSLSYLFLCRVSLFAGLTGGQEGNAILWEDSQVEWHWLSDNRFRHRATWPRDQLAVFWGSGRLVTGQRRQSLTWDFTGTMPYRLSFEFRYMVEGGDSLMVEEAEVRCVAPADL